MLIRHDTRYKLAALTAELWGRGLDAGGVVGDRRFRFRQGPGSAGIGYLRCRPRSSLFQSVFHRLISELVLWPGCRESSVLPLAWLYESHLRRIF